MRRRPSPPVDERSPTLFELGEPVAVEAELKRPASPVWTENKAQLIERYLYYFVLITKHGAYIDGFAGPQEELDDTPRWSAKLVIESEPRWLQRFFLFDFDQAQVARLEKLVEDQPPKRAGDPRRKYSISHGDFNALLPDLLASRPIKDKEATFALLDQRTFECEWRSVEALARYKPPGQNKIELFYFLPNHWLDRALAATKDTDRLRAWWGGDDWNQLRTMKGRERAELLSRRLRALGYASAIPWPIMQKADSGGSTMYYMIHASDHPEAPKLMDRAYRRVLKPREPIEQLTIEALLSQTDD